MNPLVIAYHLIVTAYGWWLPNDPRGSTSHAIATDLLAELGELHYGRKRIQPASSEIRDFYDRASDRLKHDVRTFSEEEVAQLAEAFQKTINEQRYTCWACAIMPDHVHLLIRKHRDQAETMIEELQVRSRKRLILKGARPPSHPVWGGPGWKVFLDHPDAVWRTIRYIEQNPVKLYLPMQHWSFVTPYDNWPLHDGHSPSSPYARRLRAAGRYP